MSRRSSVLSNVVGSAISRELDSKYDIIKEVSNYLEAIETVATEDLGALTAALNEAKDFTGIVVLAGEEASWDPVNKVLTVPTEKGDTGEQGIPGVDGTNNYIHVRYAIDAVGSNMSTAPSGRTYIGILVSGDVVGSGVPEDYTWVRYVGKDGIDGVDGVDGQDGSNGINGENGMVPVIEFSIDLDGNLLYDVVGYEEGPTVVGLTDEEW